MAAFSSKLILVIEFQVLGVTVISYNSRLYKTDLPTNIERTEICQLMKWSGNRTITNLTRRWVIKRMDEKHEVRLTTLKLWNLRSHCQIPQSIFTTNLKNHMQARDEVYLTAFCIFISKHKKSFLNDLYRCDFLQGECIFFYIKCYPPFVRDRVFRMWMRESLESIPSKLLGMYWIIIVFQNQ